MKTLFTPLRFFCFVIVLLVAGASSAQSIRFNFNNGITETFLLEEVRKITFTGNLLNLHLLSGTTQTWDVDDIRNYSIDGVTGIAPDATPAIFSELLVFPNPSSGEVTLRYTLHRSANVAIEIYDLQGKLVKQIVNKPQPAGKQEHTWNAMDENGLAVSPGNYLCRLNAGGQIITQRIIIQ